MTEIEILQDQLKFIDRRLSELEPLIARLKPGDYERQELQDEQSTLAGHRRATDRRLRELTGGLDSFERERAAKNAARTEALRAARMRTYREQCESTARMFEEQGDHRNARLQRLAALDAYRVACHEIQ